MFCQILSKKNKYAAILFDLHGQTTPRSQKTKTYFQRVQFVWGPVRELQGGLAAVHGRAWNAARPWGPKCTGTVGRRVFWIKRRRGQKVMRAFWPCEVTRGWSPAASACCSHCRGRRWRHCWGPAAGAEHGEGTAAPLSAARRPARRSGTACWRSSRGRSWRPCWAWPACLRGHRPGAHASLCELRTHTGGRWSPQFWEPTTPKTRRWWRAAWRWFFQVFAVVHAPPGRAAASAVTSACGLSASLGLRRCCRAGSRW